ncbi:Bug family tripartite tricarboxylate transporter substrate binding protein [Hydrogenophaga atypica]|jgi:tripartite-type tricarboxylate transporter receptor subunit TctC|uniref:Bug family tripartite tricarboxylate transporter substrate binding protein n=1 Tax=Hydrogenophaga atypica TaxID=249409 RepID=A0ABW2QQ95_9BURK
MQTSHITRRAGLAFFAFTLGLAGQVAVAQTYPSKAVTIVVPFPAGGPNDILARTLGERLADQLKQPFIIENKAGATGNIGAQSVSKAAPDGHTLLLTLDTGITANPELYGKRMGFDPARDLRPIATVARFSQMLVTSTASKITNFKQFVDSARQGLNYASAGNASPGHLTTEALQSLIQGNLNHVSYRGNAPAVIDLLGGQVEAGFMATPSVAQHVSTGKLTALAVSGNKRSPLAPNVPTIAELGYPAGTTEFGYVLLAPSATPEAVVQLLNAEVRKALASPALRDKLKTLDIDPVGSTTQQAADDLVAGRARWSKVIKERGIKAD